MTATVFRYIDTPIGLVVVFGRSNALIGVAPAEQQAALIRDDWQEANRALCRVRDQLSQYFEGSRRVFDLPLQLEGTAFQLAVWSELRNIPFGHLPKHHL